MMIQSSFWRWLPCCLLLVLAQAQAGAQVKIWEETVTLPTYQLGPGDLNPRFHELDGTIIFPYTMQDAFTTEIVDQTYQALYLENEYLKVMVLPAIGGRVHSVFDKSRGEEMFHLLDVIRPARIALRGAWIPGGIEWNPGPQAHTVIAYSPVNAALQQHEDGSASVVITNTLKDSRLRWQARVTLHPGRSYLDQNIRIDNPTDGIHPYYFWNNTCFPNYAGTRFICPTDVMTDHHGRTFTPWPIHNGVDMTRLENYGEQTPFFAYKCTFDFFGAYNTVSDHGIVQTADHRVLPGKKYWTWGKADYGQQRMAIMGHEDVEYVEVQSGPLATQSDYEPLAPQSTVQWREWWYPVHGLGEGFEFATTDLAIQAERPGRNLVLRMLATGEFPAARVMIEPDGGRAVTRSVDLSPAAPVTVRVRGVGEAPARVRVLAGDGTVLADYRTPLEVPKIENPQAPSRETHDTPSGLYAQAVRADRDSARAEARRLYQRALEADPQHVEALRALAVLEIEAGQYEQAATRLAQAVKLDPARGALHCLAAVASLNLGEPARALDQALEGLRRPDTRSWGWDLAGRAHLRRGEPARAVEAFAAALAAEPLNLRARDHLLMALIAAGRPDEAREQAQAALADDPTGIVAAMTLVQAGDLEARQLSGRLRSIIGEPDFEALDTAIDYAGVGLLEAAEQLLWIASVNELEPAQVNPIALYWLAWLSDARGNQGDATRWLAMLDATSDEDVIPSHPETIAVLSWAIERRADDARARLHLGNLLAGLGRLDEAPALWQQAVDIDPTLAVGWRNLALFEWKNKKDLKAAEQLYARAIEARPGDQTYWRDRAQVLLEDNRPAEAAALLEPQLTLDWLRDDLRLTLVRAWLAEKRYDEALEQLGAVQYVVGEFTSDTHDLFVRALLERGRAALEQGKAPAALADFKRALTYPPNLGIGRRAKPEEAERLYWLGQAHQALGQPDQARAAWQQAADQVEGRANQSKYRQLCIEALRGPAPSR